MKAVAPEWGTAEVAGILTASDFNDEQSFAAFALKTDSELIYSLDPAEDYEINPHTINGWRMLFFSDNGETLGDADYFVALKQLEPFTIDQNNNSILIKKLTQDELEQVYHESNGQNSIQLTF